MQYLKELLKPFKSTVLATIGKNNYPFNSYAPFYYDGEIVYIFISDVATHAQNMRDNSKSSAFFVEDESMTSNIFRRKRISLQCDVEKITRENARFSSIMETFQDKFEGATLAMLMTMKDFNLYALTPIYGEATFGFGEAYNIGGEKMNQLVVRTEDSGHK